ncbi:unnamed protein product [Lactuca virosa]|uniref:Transmembrane protein n=1 Tax=Lactuca virosa TaxID=75947 RepID=A0AAU9LES0_9ASTR|nr:unnamed protein product [Lactuca virosa]
MPSVRQNASKRCRFMYYNYTMKQKTQDGAFSCHLICHSIIQNLFLYGYGAIFNFLGILATVLIKANFDISFCHRCMMLFLMKSIWLQKMSQFSKVETKNQH